jgi:hypothetical protein
MGQEDDAKMAEEEVAEEVRNREFWEMSRSHGKYYCCC